jgi:hypothetical protein
MLVAPTADGSRPGYGIWDKIKNVGKKVIGKVADIIPNEIKDPIAAVAKSPIGKAALMYAGGAGLGSLAAGQGLGSLAQLSTYNPMNVMSNIGTGIGRGITGAKNLLGMDKAVSTDVTKAGNILTGGGINPTGMDGRSSALQKIAGIIPDVADTAGRSEALQKIARSGIDKITDTQDPWYKKLYDTFLGPSTYGEGENAQTINWKTPLAIGLTAGAIQKAMPKDVMPAQPGIDIADISSRALTGSDPDLRFLPPASATTAYAQGGRIGYDSGTDLRNKMSKLLIKLANGTITDEEMIELRNIESASGFSRANEAQGGRIGYANGTVPLTQYEKEISGYSPGDIAYEKEKFRKLLELKSDKEKRDLLHWDDQYTMGHRAMEYSDDPVFEEFYETGEHFNRGGRVAAQEGGLMDLGGMEKDYRQEGGFVPIGGQERADDVPARLSKNEFVFTADAVRSAGGGDIDKGAEVMENVMNNLEQGGQISQESQGLEGARNMFATAQRLEGVL